MKWARKTIATLVMAYAMLVSGCYFMQRSLMYFPLGDLSSPATAGAPEMAEVTLHTSDGLDLVSWYARAARPDLPTIAYFHGNAGHIGNRVSKVRPFLDEGYGVLLVSYRGYGGNSGSPTEEGLFTDGRAALDFLADQGLPRDGMVVLGESLGSGVAVRMASEREVGAVILEAPFTSAADAGQDAYPFLPVGWLIKDRFDSIAYIGRIAAPLLILHGERDRIVPATHGRRLLAAGNEPKEGVFLSEAGHNDLHYHGAARIEINFLRRVFGD